MYYGYLPGVTSGSNTVRPTPDRFFTMAPPERIIGVEMEYNVQARDRNGQTHSVSEYITRKALMEAGIKSIAGYTELGSRIYSDVEHAEHCTPECRGPYQAAAADIASIAILSSIIDASGVGHNGVYRISGTWLTDAQRSGERIPNVTNGIHENFMAPARLSTSKLLPLLLPTYYATRVATMAGSISNNTYTFSQKSQGIGGAPIAYALDRRTAPGNKPMLLALSGEATTVDDGWMRIETRYADAPLSLAARRHALASTSLVLRLLEHESLFKDEDFSDIILKDPVAATHQFMADLTLQSTAEVVSGKQMSMLDINEKLVEKVQFLFERGVALPQDEVRAVDAWTDINDAFRRSKPHLVEYDPMLLRDFPVATKHYWLNKIGAFDKGDAESKTRSMQWDRVLPIGTGIKMMENSSVHDADVENLKISPPSTRAKIRGSFIKKNYDNPDADVTNWRKGKFSYGASVSFGDAYGNANY